MGQFAAPPLRAGRPIATTAMRSKFLARRKQRTDDVKRDYPRRAGDNLTLSKPDKIPNDHFAQAFDLHGPGFARR